MTPRLSGHFSTFDLVIFVLKSLLGIARQWSLEKFAVLTLKPWSHVRILIYLRWAIDHSRNTITYHNALCLSLQNFAYALSSVSLGS